VYLCSRLSYCGCCLCLSCSLHCPPKSFSEFVFFLEVSIHLLLSSAISPAALKPSPLLSLSRRNFSAVAAAPRARRQDVSQSDLWISQALAPLVIDQEGRPWSMSLDYDDRVEDAELRRSPLRRERSENSREAIELYTFFHLSIESVLSLNLKFGALELWCVTVFHCSCSDLQLGGRFRPSSRLIKSRPKGSTPGPDIGLCLTIGY
jgi:hypothetical protein